MFGEGFLHSCIFHCVSVVIGARQPLHVLVYMAGRREQGKVWYVSPFRAVGFRPVGGRQGCRSSKLIMLHKQPEVLRLACRSSKLKLHQSLPAVGLH